MSWVHGSAVLAYIDTDGIPTYTAFPGEVSSTYDIQQPVSSVVNKATTGAAGADIAPGAVHTMTVSGHVDDTVLDAAFDRVMTQLRAENKCAMRFVEPAPYDTYTGDAVCTNHNLNAPNDPYVKSASFQFDGLPTQATTS